MVALIVIAAVYALVVGFGLACLKWAGRAGRDFDDCMADHYATERDEP